MVDRGVMSSSRIPFRRIRSRSHPGTEVEAAVRLVAGGSARTVRLTGIHSVERAAARLASPARDAGVAIRVERLPGHESVVIVERLSPPDRE
jgi:hypothetical protein